MDEVAEHIPEALRRRIAADMKPVRPLPPPWVRLLWIVPLVGLLFVVPAAWFGVRNDLEELGPLLSWLPVAVQVLLGMTLLAMALREAIPGFGVSRALIAGFSLLALVLHVGVNVAIYLSYPMGAPAFWSSWWACFHYETLLGVPFLVVVTWLAAGALPVRPRTIGLLSGAGAGVLADASWRLICPVSTPSHFTSAHLGAVLLLACLGFGCGYAWERIRTG